MKKKIAALIFGFAFVFMPQQKALAVTAADCDPWPEATEAVLDCIDYYQSHPEQKTYDPGTDPADPATFPYSGIGGVAAGYSPKSDEVLIIESHIVRDDFRPTYGMMADPKTLAIKGTAFRIDSNGGSGNPHIAYSPDSDKFLVVWGDYGGCGNCLNIYGRFVSGSGAPEGRDFFIQSGAGSSDIDYDTTNKRFVIGFERGNAVNFKTVALDGKLSEAHRVIGSFHYQGQLEVAANTHTNEYWFVYATVYTGDDTGSEDDRIYLSKVNAQTLAVVGSPVQLSETRPGRLAVQNGHVAYSPEDGAAVTMWLERGREGIAGMWGRTVSDDGSMSDVYPIITAGTEPYSEGYAATSIEYNRWTQTFFVASGDWDGRAWSTELDASGAVYWSNLALDVTVAYNSWFNRFLGINLAQAAPGSFNIAQTVTPYGSATFASRNYTTVAGTTFFSPTGVSGPNPAPAPTPTPPPAPAAINLGSLSIAVNQIYIWSLALGALLALLMIVVGGYITLTAAGNAERASRGKTYITSSLIGLALLFGAYLLLNTINPDLVNFRSFTTTQTK
ncbi:MAG: hypothetical protein KW788_01675 [Candidatus Doudnabacteria bacterium]|nr:hypothetical protein [Candidatus Doudnabacteria bacterium]